MFLFTWDVTTSPMRDVLGYVDLALEVFPLRDGRPVCPISAPPQLAILEPEPERPLGALLHGLEQHPVIGRVPHLLVVDVQWLSMADRFGVADFLVRGFRPAEALARVNRLVGRLEPRALPNVLDFDGLVIDTEGFEARIAGVPIALTPQEFALLRHLSSVVGRVQTREALLQRVWGRAYAGGVRTVDIHIQRLRSKLGDPHQQRIVTVRGVGYKWAEARRP